jgi:OFA family oxalate/formate antiporter-like MFS transporter
MSNERSAQTDLAQQTYGPIVGNRWVQLAAGVMAMVVISNFQYAFTLFTPGLKQQFPAVPYSDIALIFSCLFCLKPGRCRSPDTSSINSVSVTSCSIGSILILLGWVLGGLFATSVFHLHLLRRSRRYRLRHHLHCHRRQRGQMVSRQKGLGGRPDRRGIWGWLGAHAHPDQRQYCVHGWAGAMTAWGVGQGVVAIAMALILHHPQRLVAQGLGAAQGGCANAAGVFRDADDVAERVLYHVRHVPAVCTGGLMTTGNMSQIAKSLNVFDAKVMGIAIVPFVATLAGVTNAFARIMWGGCRQVRPRIYDGLLRLRLKACSSS